MKTSKFTSVEDYISYILEEHVSQMASPEHDETCDNDEKIVMERLRKLGYID